MKLNKYFSFLLFLSISTVFMTCSPFGNKKIISATDLKCEYLANPLGVDVARPRLGWVVQSDIRGQRQTAYRILVARSRESLSQDNGDLWDSGKINSAKSIQIVYAGEKLQSGMECFWKVMIWAQNGKASPWSKSAKWEMGLLSEADWQGYWINDGKSNPVEDRDFFTIDDPAPLFRRDFEVSGKIKKARLYITGLGYYEARINGRKVDDRVLDPGWTNYAKEIYYSTYDVTEMLKAGKNALGVMVGNGWFNPLPLKMWGRLNLRKHLPVGRPMFIAQLNIEYENGTTQPVYSDETWKVAKGPLLKNNIYLGETYDARKEKPDWNKAGFDDRDWAFAKKADVQSGKLVWQHNEPIRRTKVLKPVQITEPRPGVYVFDMGQNFAGQYKLRVKGPSGTKITMRFGELLYEDGTVNTRTAVCGQIKRKEPGMDGSPAVAEQKDIYILKGNGNEEYVPHFTFHGFRYVEMTGFPGRPTADSFTGYLVNSDVEPVGNFECSNKLFNQIFEMVRWTFLSNLFSVQSDCPARERFGYGGDLAATSNSFIYLFDMSQFYTKTVRDWGRIDLANGGLPDTAPYVGINYCGPGWQMAYPQTQMQLYRYYGETRLLKEQFPRMSAWMDELVREYPDHLADGLSDHESLAPTAKGLMPTAFYHECANQVSQIARINGFEIEAQKYSDLASEIKKVFQSRYLLDDGTVWDRQDAHMEQTQASQAFGLYLNLIPDGLKEAAFDLLVKKIDSSVVKIKEKRIELHNHLTTGLHGTDYLFNVLAENGRSDLVSAMVGQIDFPGYGYMLENGATTLWEHWAGSDDVYSQNHPMLGSVSEWFFKWLGGIRPADDAYGFDRIIIQPQIVDGLKWVRSSYRSIRGKIVSDWEKDAGENLRLRITIPANTSAIVHVPASSAKKVKESGVPAEQAEEIRFLEMKNGTAVYQVGSGHYSFEVER